jgi:hypothetical protein
LELIQNNILSRSVNRARPGEAADNLPHLKIPTA